jgi:hypothetical protein
MLKSHSISHCLLVSKIKIKIKMILNADGFVFIASPGGSDSQM